VIEVVRARERGVEGVVGGQNGSTGAVASVCEDTSPQEPLITRGEGSLGSVSRYPKPDLSIASAVLKKRSRVGR